MFVKLHSSKPDSWSGQANLVHDQQASNGKPLLVIDGRPVPPDEADQAGYEVTDATEEEISQLRDSGYHLWGTFTPTELNGAKQQIRVIVRWQKATEFSIEDFAARLKVHPNLAAAAAESLAQNGELERVDGRYRLRSYGVI